MLKRSLVFTLMLLALVSSGFAAEKEMPDGIVYHKDGKEERFSIEDDKIILAEKFFELRQKLIQEERLLQVSSEIVEKKNGDKKKTVILTASVEKTNSKPFEVMIYKTDNDFFADETQVALTKEIKNNFFLISRYEQRKPDGEREIILILNRQLML